jgi:hypothetical protein
VEKYPRAGHATDYNIIPRMRFAFWVNMAKDAHSEYVILNGFPLQEWLRERASILPYIYIACHVSVKFGIKIFVSLSPYFSHTL